MPQNRSRKTTKSHSKKLKVRSLEYQRFEDRNLLAADFQMGPDALTVLRAEISEIAQRPDDVVQQQLAAQQDTNDLQSGLSNLVEIAARTEDGQTTTVFQQTWNGLPVYGSFVTTVQNEAGEVTNVRDQTLSHFDGHAQDNEPLSSDRAIGIATRGLTKPSLMESSAYQAWYTAGDRVRLAWVVETAVSNPDGDIVDQYETWVNVFNGGVFTQDNLGESVEGMLDDPITDIAIEPWVVINDDIGPAGSQALAAPFDAVVQISVGCTGTLISPNAVLSARHCGILPGDIINFGVDSRNPDFQFTVATSLDPDGAGTLLDGGDVSIHTLTEDVPASVASPMRLTDLTDELVGEVGMWIGYGANGVGSTGSGVTADGLRWAAENIIDAFGQAAPINFGENIFTSDFDNGDAANSSTGSTVPLELEGMGGPGDSGGPMLVNLNGEWVVGAVVSGGTTRTSEYGTVGWWTGIADYRTQIENVGGEFVFDESSLGFNRDQYFEGDEITISVFDPNVVGNSISVTVTSDTGDSETLTIQESDTVEGSFVITIPSANSNIVFNDGTLQVTEGDQIDLTYFDADDGNGLPDTLTDFASIVAVFESELIGVDFDTNITSTPNNWTPVLGGTDQTVSDLLNESDNRTPVDITVNGTVTALDVAINADTIPLYPSLLTNVNGQIQSGGETIEVVYSDLVASSDYLVYVMAAEGVFDSIQQTVSIQGLGSPITFEQRFDQGDLFINDLVGDSTRDLSEYAQLVTSNIDGEIVIQVSAIEGSQDVVLAGIAIVPDTAGIDAVTDYEVTTEDQSVVLNVTANDTEKDGQDITLQSVAQPINGTATITETGNVEYTPGNNFAGSDSFTYVISDPDGNTATGTVFIGVEAENDAPSGVFLTPDSIAENTSTVNDALVGSLFGVDVDDSSHTFSFATGTGDTDNPLFNIVGSQLFIKAGTDIDFDVKPEYSIRVEVSDGEESFEAALTISVIDVVDAVSVSLDSGDGQRSMVTDTVLTFNEVVTINPGAFVVTKRGPGGGNVGVTPTIDNTSGVTVVTLTFFGQHVTGAGSLEDGNYQLTVDGEQIITAGGAALDADGDGEAGGSFIFGDTATDNFFRLFGDSNGDRFVSTIDLLPLRRTFLDRIGDASFDDRFDFDADGVISTIDLLRFRKNFLDRLDFA